MISLTKSLAQPQILVFGHSTEVSTGIQLEDDTNILLTLFMFAPCINSIKALFIIPTYTHNYNIIVMLKTIKIPTISPSCFGSHRNHHQGVISCLAKSTIMILLCSSCLPRPCTAPCTTGCYAAITLTTSLMTSTIES
jgi:hypothetical protein